MEKTIRWDVDDGTVLDIWSRKHWEATWENQKEYEYV